MGHLSYDGAVEVLGRALTFGINPSLDGITELCDALGRPQDAFSVVQVAGTNGKTSTSRIVHALLRAHGVSAALYTSPELTRVNERMEIGAGPVSDEQFAEAVSAALLAAEELRPGRQGSAVGFTEFELTTAAALWLFRQSEVDVAVLEVGLGGRWDATSVAVPAVAVITGIGLDHAAILGDTLEEIAAEKAAIIRPASAPVLGPGTVGLEPVFLALANEVHAHARAVREEGTPTPVAEEMTVRFEVLSLPRSPFDPTRLTVRGVHGTYAGLEFAAPAYQAGNVATALAAAEAALGRSLDPPSVSSALASLTLPGRFEVVRREPPIVVDGAHNPQAAAVLADAIADAWPDVSARPALLLGILADKDARGIVEPLAGTGGRITTTSPDSPRALSAAALARLVEEVTGCLPPAIEQLPEAVAQTAASSPAGLVITGSLTTAGQARSVLLDDSATAREPQSGRR